MATTTWTCNKDATTADNGTSLGAGAWDWLPTGDYAGYDYRTFMGFNYSFTGIVSITSARLYMKTTSQVKVAFAGGGDMVVQRVSSSWSEGSATSLSSTNAIERSNEPGVTGTSTAFNVNNTENTWDSVDITTIIQEAFAAGTFYGLRMVAATGSDVTEHWAREYGSNDAYISVTYTTNTLPTAPTLSSPANGATAQSLTPTFVFTHNDAEGDACASYDIQVSSNNDTFSVITHFDGANQTLGISGDTITALYSSFTGETALSNNTTYYWRVRTNDGTDDGTWSSTRSFTTAALPTATLTTPSSSGVFAKLTKGATTWAAPRLNVGWTFACSNSGTQSSYQVVITQSSTGAAGTYSAFEDSGTVSSATTSFVSDATVTNGYHYKVKVRVTCSHGQTSSYTSEYIAKTVWGEALHRYDCTSAPVSWSIGSIGTTLPSLSSIVLEYGSNSTTTTPATFYSSVSSLTLARYFFYKVYLLPPYNSASVTFPSLDNLSLTFTSNILVPDAWTLSDDTVQTIDTSTAVHGTQSLKLTGDTNVHAAYQLVSVKPNTDYILSGYIKSVGNSTVFFGFSSAGVYGGLVNTSSAFPQSADSDWTHAYVEWNSGANTQVYVHCRNEGGAVGTYAYMDGLTLVEGTVAMPWQPSLVGAAATLDGGVQVDASEGGVFRLRGATGGTRDTVSLGNNGLIFGGDVNLYSDTADELRTNDSLQVDGFFRQSGTSFPASPSTSDRYFRSDSNLATDFRYDGTRWNSVNRHVVSFQTVATLPISVTSTTTDRMAIPPMGGGSDLNLKELVTSFYVVGGTALSASHKWVGTFRKVSGVSPSTIGSITIDSGNLSEWRSTTTTLDVLLGSGYEELEIIWTKTGTPGNLHTVSTLSYYLVAT